jgi:hypothetical protein
MEIHGRHVGPGLRRRGFGMRDSRLSLDRTRRQQYAEAKSQPTQGKQPRGQKSGQMDGKVFFHQIIESSNFSGLGVPNEEQVSHQTRGLN